MFARTQMEDVSRARRMNCTVAERLILTISNGGIGLVVDIFTTRTISEDVSDGRQDQRQATQGRPSRGG